MTNHERYYVYCHKIRDNIFYIGSNWKAGDSKRAWSTKRRPKKWHEIVSKNNGHYSVEILEYFRTSGEARKRETELIHFYHDLGQAEASGEDHRGERNQMAGISLNEILSEEKNKQWRLNLSKSRQKEKNPFFGKKHTKATKEILRNINIGKKYSEEVNKKKGLSGGQNVNSKKIKITFSDGTTTTFDYIGKACEVLGITGYIVSKLANTREPYKPRPNRYKHLEGMKVEYIEEEL